MFETNSLELCLRAIGPENLRNATRHLWPYYIINARESRWSFDSVFNLVMNTLVCSLILSLLFATQHASAHWYLSCFGKGTGGCVEGASQNPYNKAIGSNGLLQTAPIAPADSNPEMKCGTMGVPSHVVAPIQVSPGDSMMMQWLHDTGAPWDPRMNANHHGFVFVYLAPFSSAGEGNVWTKIYGDGLQPSTDEARNLWQNPANTDSCTTGDMPADRCTVVPFVGWWATDKLRMSKGVTPFKLPSGLPSGKYIIRGELLTTWLPGTVSTAQGYIGCSVIQIGSGEDQSASLSQLSKSAVAIPEAYTGSPWMHYDLHAQWMNGAQQPPTNLPQAPGPPVWGGVVGGTWGSNFDLPATMTGSPRKTPVPLTRRKRGIVEGF